jgi:hypothetical protein
MVLRFGGFLSGDRCSPPVAVLARWRRTEKGIAREREGWSAVSTRSSHMSAHSRREGAGMA